MGEEFLALTELEDTGPDDIGHEFQTMRDDRELAAFRTNMIRTLANQPEDAPLPTSLRDAVLDERARRQADLEAHQAAVAQPTVPAEVVEFAQEEPIQGPEPEGPAEEPPVISPEDVETQRQRQAESMRILVEARRMQRAGEFLQTDFQERIAAAEPGEAAQFPEAPPGPAPPLINRFASQFGQGVLGAARDTLNALPALEEFADLPQTMRFFGNTAQEMGLILDEAAQALPSVEDPTFADQFFQALGSSMAFFAPGVAAGAAVRGIGVAAPRLARVLGATVSGVNEAAAEAGGIYESLRSVVGDAEAARRANAVFWRNAVLTSVSNKLGVFSENLGVVRRAVGGMIGEGAQEALQYDIQRNQMYVPLDHPSAQNLAEQGWEVDAEQNRVYMPFRLADAGEAAAIGALVGGIAGPAVGALTDAMQPTQENVARVETLLREPDTPIAEAFAPVIEEDRTDAAEILPNTQVVDDDGKPKRVFHGTSRVFEDFDAEMADANALYGPGFYFTEEPAVAGGSNPETRFDLGYASVQETEQEEGDFRARRELERLRAQRELLTGPEGQAELDRLNAEAPFLSPLNPVILTMDEAVADIETAIRQEAATVERSVAKPNVRPAYLDIQNAFSIEDTIPHAEAEALMREAGADDEAVANMQRVFTISTSGVPGENLYGRLESVFARTQPDVPNTRTKALINDLLQQHGYDGITHMGGAITGTAPHRVWIAFQPEQITPAFDIMAAMQARPDVTQAAITERLAARQAPPTDVAPVEDVDFAQTQPRRTGRPSAMDILRSERGAIQLPQRPFFRTMAARRRAEAEEAQAAGEQVSPPREALPPEALAEETPEQEARRFPLRTRAEGLPVSELRTPGGALRVPLRFVPSQELELQDFIRQQRAGKSGIKLEGEELHGELQALISPKETGTTGLQNNVHGRTLQEIAEEANERGFIATADKTAFLEALDRSIRGTPVMSTQATGFIPVRDDSRVASLMSDIVDIADRYERIVQDERRGAMRVQEINDTAAEMIRSGEVTMGKVMAREPGAPVTPELASAVVQTTVNAFDFLQQSAADYVRTGAEENSREEKAFFELFRLFMAIDPKRFGAMAESGRTLRILGDPLSASNRVLSQVRDVIAKSPDMSARRLAQMILSLNNVAEMSTVVETMERASLGDMFVEAWINGLLSSPQTHLVNFFSNMMVAGFAIPERFLAARLPGTSGDVAPGEATAFAFGLTNSVREGLRVMASSFRSGIPLSGVSKLEIRNRSITAENMPFGGVDPDTPVGQALDLFADYGIRLPGNALMASDEFFKFINFRAEQYAQAYRRGYAQGVRGDEALATFAEAQLPETSAFREAVEAGRAQNFTGDDLAAFVEEQFRNFDPAIMQKAKDFSLYQTFQNEMNGPLGQAAMTASNIRTPGGFPVGKMILPFVRTPVNIFKFAWHRNPAAAFLSAEVREQLNAGGATRDLAIARLTFGSMVLAAGAGLAAVGWITGRGPEDRGLRQAMRRQGWQPYSMKVWNPARQTFTYVGYNRFEPMGMMFGITADVVESWYDQDLSLMERTLAMTLLAFSRNFTSKTWIRGLAEFMDAIGPRGFEQGARTVSAAERFGIGRLQTFVPRFVASTERAVSPERESRIMTELNDLVNIWRSQVPGWSDEVPKDRNGYGDPILLGYGFTNKIVSGIFNAVSPLYMKDAKPNVVDQELMKQRVDLMPPAKVWSERTPAQATDQSVLQDEDPGRVQRLALNARQYEAYQVYASANHKEIADLGLPPYPRTSMEAVHRHIGRTITGTPRQPGPTPPSNLSMFETLRWLMQTPSYRAMSDGELGGKADALRTVIRIFREQGKELATLVDQDLFNKVNRARDFLRIQQAPPGRVRMEERALILQERRQEGRGLAVGQ